MNTIRTDWFFVSQELSAEDKAAIVEEIGTMPADEDLPFPWCDSCVVMHLDSFFEQQFSCCLKRCTTKQLEWRKRYIKRAACSRLATKKVPLMIMLHAL